MKCPNIPRSIVYALISFASFSGLAHELTSKNAVTGAAMGQQEIAKPSDNLINNTPGSWRKLLKKHGYSTLIGSLLGAISGATTAITNQLFERNGYNCLNFYLFTILTSLVTFAISQDAKKNNLDFDMRTSLSASIMSMIVMYSMCTRSNNYA